MKTDNVFKLKAQALERMLQHVKKTKMMIMFGYIRTLYKNT